MNFSGIAAERGVMAEVNDNETVVQTDVPGIDEDGHEWIKVEKNSEGIFTLTYDDEVVSNKENGETFLHALAVTAEVEFVSGSWERFQAGEPVQVQYTQKGLEVFKNAFRDSLLRKITKMCEINIASSGQPWRVEVTIVDLELCNSVYTFRRGKCSHMETKQ